MQARYNFPWKNGADFVRRLPVGVAHALEGNETENVKNDVGRLFRATNRSNGEEDRHHGDRIADNQKQRGVMKNKISKNKGILEITAQS